MLIGACGREGYHARAFQLHREYRKREFRTNFGIIADLFNACANSPFRESALESARGLRRSVLERNLHLPDVAYHTMVKAFGRCGDLETAFSLVDEMEREKLPVTYETYNHLLQGCVSDKESGFRHAVIVWRRMMEAKRVKPDVHSFKLLLRATRGI